VSQSTGERILRELSIEDYIKPCLDAVLSDCGRFLLNKVTEMQIKDSEATLYSLEKEYKGCGSKYKLEKTLKDLVECGFLEREESTGNEARERRPKKLIHVTPLGAAMNVLLKLLYPEAEDELEMNFIYSLAAHYIDETLFQALPFIYDYMVRLVEIKKSRLGRKNVFKGFLTAVHVCNMLLYASIVAEERLGITPVPSLDLEVSKEILQSKIDEDLRYFENAKREVKEGSLHYKVIEALINGYSKLQTVLQVHASKIERSQGSSRMS
jgi:DNA-binding HxlR family transcriptional regulator